ncbi:hypothetical protein [Methylovirgula sp. HY1]|uniref:hypothetical protein n=1 Tax=Methylovirgula sp. HY1 TaxID=2822761 RepID=UPI001C5B174C|nr:hypothetical protein [Methylovirgula sp. HY1]QXX73556.1 hypothetical protein MHY1_00352 [Methylovirgula sp. HY1]
MSAPFKMKHRAELAALLGRRKLAFSGIIGVAVLLLLLGPFVLTPIAFEMFVTLKKAKSAMAPHFQTAARAASPWRDPSWAGGLESPHGLARLASPREEPLTSASYTSGFDEKAAGLGPLPPETPLLRLTQRDPRACPDDLNCSFRSAQGSLPPRRPIVATAVFEHVKTASLPETAAASKSSGFSLPLLPVRLSWPAPHLQLPTATSLLKPFAFVSNTVVGFVKKL